MNELGHEFSEGYEHKPAAMKARMRQRQRLSVGGLLAIEKQIKVNYAWAFRLVSRSSEGLLHSQQSLHQFLRRRKRVTSQFCNHVEKSRLREGFHWFGFIDLGESTYLESGGEHPAYSQQKISGAVPEVGAETDVSGYLRVVDGHGKQTAISVSG